MTVVRCPACGTKNRIDETRVADQRAVCGKCGTALNAKSGHDKPIVVTDATLQSELQAAAGTPMLVDCWAPWCGPCRMVAPVLDQLAAESDGRYVIAKLNVDDNPRTAAQFKIQNIPTMLIFKNSSLIDRIVGMQPKQQIAAKLASYAS